jgi:sulfur carrier protein ThiS
MALRIELSSYFRTYVSSYDRNKGVEVPFEAGKTVEQVIRELGLPREEVVVMTVNRSSVRPDHVLQDGDLIGLFPAALGG